MKEPGMRETIGQLVRAMTSRSHTPRGGAIPRRLRPHVARSTFTPVRDAGLARALAA